MNINIRFLLCFVSLLSIPYMSLSAQESIKMEKENKRAWEIGIGGTGFYMPRSGLKSVEKFENKGYFIDINKRDFLFGGQLYIARELSNHFALDFQGSLGYSKDPVRTTMKDHYVAMGTLGLQWRMGKYFDSNYVDPFFRVGAGYMYKNFKINYMDALDGFNLSQSNEGNKSGNDRTHLVPITAGIGVNMWLNDRFGIGMQSDYLYLPYKDIANSFQGTVRLLWRIGGNTKKAFVYVPVEKVVEREVIREVKRACPTVKEVPTNIYKLFSSIYFEFDKDVFASETEVTLNEIAEMLKQNSSMRYCVIGCADSLGSEEYNQKLSERRAQRVVQALIERGVPAQILKWRGVGKSIAYASSSESNEVRRGDRKILVEVVDDNDYWQALK